LLKEKGINKEVRVVLQQIDLTRNEQEENLNFEQDEKPDLNNISEVETNQSSVKKEPDIENIPLAVFKKKKSSIEKFLKMQDLSGDQQLTEMISNIDGDDSNNADWTMDIEGHDDSYENLLEIIKESSEKSLSQANKEHLQDVTCREKELKTIPSSKAPNVSSTSSQKPDMDKKNQTGSIYKFDFNKTIVEPDDLDDYVKM